MTRPLPPKNRKRCIPIYRPHAWHWHTHNEVDHILVLRCGRCFKYKVITGWEQ
jgi:hypothetical protein